MKLIFKIFLLILFFSPMVYSLTQKTTSDCAHTKTSFKCVKYIKNYDGDTITFKIPGVHHLIQKIPVRVSGIDTPEVRTKNACEKKAARTAQKLVQSILSKAQRIDLQNIQRGKYFRIVADVIADGRSLKDVLLSQKLAVNYDGGKKSINDWCRLPAQAK